MEEEYVVIMLRTDRERLFGGKIAEWRGHEQILEKFQG